MPNDTTHSKLPFLPSLQQLDMTDYKSMVINDKQKAQLDVYFKNQLKPSNTTTFSPFTAAPILTTAAPTLTVVRRSQQNPDRNHYIVFNKSFLLHTEEDDDIYLGYDDTNQCPVGVRVHKYNEHRDNVIARIKPKTEYSNANKQKQEQSYDKKILTDEMRKYVKRINEKTEILRRKNYDSITRTFYPQYEDIEGHQKIENDSLVTIMPLEEGIPLTDFMDNTITFPPGRLLQIMLNSCKSLQHLHRQNISHRNISLDTILCNSVTGETSFVGLGSAHIYDSNPTISADAVNNYINNSSKKNSSKHIPILDIETSIDVYSLGITLAKLIGFLPIHSQKTSLSCNSKKAKARIPNNALRDRIHTLLNQMKNKNPKKRPSLDKAIETISSLWEYCLDVTSHMKKTALVDLDELNKEDDNSKEILAALRWGQFDEIQLISKKAAGNDTYLKAREKFAHPNNPNLNLPIGNVVHHNTDSLLIKLAQQDSDDHIVRQYFLISPDNKLQSKEICHIDPTSIDKREMNNTIKSYLCSRIVSSIHMQCIETHLLREWKRLNDKYPKFSFLSLFGVCRNKIATQRITDMRKTLTSLSEKKRTINYRELYETLAELEDKMIPVRSFFSNKSTGRQNINKIKSHFSTLMLK